MKDLLRIVTAGSVDDGKSTLLGRILADLGQIPDDQMAQALDESARRGHDGLDPSLLLDGLEDERAQGITIDVAYRYFATDRRAFVLADAPGHARYTRNMATGAAGCNVALLLVDAERGVGTQTRRHAFVAALMGVRHVVVAVNKMDRVGWSQEVFENIRDTVSELIVRLDITDVSFVPVSALLGANVLAPSPDMPWFRGPPLMERLETMHVASDRNLVDMRFPVQTILRAEAENYRGAAGTLSAGVLREGDEVLILPKGERAHVTSVRTPKGAVREAFAGQAITCSLDRELDVARGDVLVHPHNRPQVGRHLDATLVWMDETPLGPERSYHLRLGMRWTTARIQSVRHRIDVETGHRTDAETAALNDIVRVRLELGSPVVYDEFRRVRDLGGFILVDRDTNATAAAGVVINRGPADAGADESAPQVVWLDASEGSRARAASLARELSISGRRSVRLDTEALAPVVGDPQGPEGVERALAAARLAALGGAIPVVLLDSFPRGAQGVLHAPDSVEVEDILARLVS